MNIEEFTIFLAEHRGRPVNQQEAEKYLQAIDKTIDEAVDILRDFDEYLANVKPAVLPDTSTPEGKLHYEKLTDPFGWKAVKVDKPDK